MNPFNKRLINLFKGGAQVGPSKCPARWFQLDKNNRWRKTWANGIVYNIPWALGVSFNQPWAKTWTINIQGPRVDWKKLLHSDEDMEVNAFVRPVCGVLQKSSSFCHAIHFHQVRYVEFECIQSKRPSLRCGLQSKDLQTRWPLCGRGVTA